MADSIIKNIVFNKRPIVIPVDYRPIYKLTQIVLILKICCRDEKSSLPKLHLFVWAMKNEDNMQELINVVNSNFNETIDVWSMEPALIRALDYALQESICEAKDGKIKLTSKGSLFYNKIQRDNNILWKERTFLNVVKKRFTEERIQKNIEKWGLKNVKN